MDIPERRLIANSVDKTQVAELLEANELRYLQVLSRGNHLVIYSEQDGEKHPRVRFTRIAPKTFQLGIANHRGTWEPTPYTGTIPELFALLTNEFSFVLVNY